MADFVGTPGDDTLSGASGADTMRGLGGNDNYIVDHPGDVVIENPGEGVDIIFSAVSYALNDTWEVEVLATIAFDATNPINLTGNGLANYMIGNDGANTLDGKAGADVMVGRAGHDTYIVYDAGDQVVEDAGGGSDIVFSAVSYALNDGSEVEVLATIAFDATAPINLTGNGLANYMIGNDGANTLDGKAGADVMVGRAGNDTYIVYDAGDQVVEDAGGGIDIVFSAVSYALNDGSEVEVLATIAFNGTDPINLTGNGLDNYMIGNDGANTLDGKAGADVMVGRAGNDTYIVYDAGDEVVEDAGGGSDIVFSAVSYALNDGSEVEVLATIAFDGTAPINLTGNGLANYMIGNDGANQLDGKAGADVMVGRAGHDTYIVYDAGDEVVEDAGGGSDIVFSAVSYALNDGSEVEVLATIAFDGTAPIDLTGNGLDNYMIGNDGANTLDGKAGADVMVGRAGHDTYIVYDAGDEAVENAGGGSDIVFSAVSYALNDGSEVEVLATIAFDATDPINLTGNGLANHMIGNDGANTLDGKAGADVMAGRAGNDTYIVDNGGDQVVENAGGGNDIIYSAVSYTLGDGQEIESLATLDWGATDAIAFTGNSGANHLNGNAGANVLDGKGGNDVLQGREGADTFAFTTAPGAGNVDLIFDFNVADDTIRLGGDSGQPFAALASGALAASAFVIGAAAADADDVLIYNSATGALFFDADGSGAVAAVQFATVSAGLALTAADFTVSGPANAPPAITSPTTASVLENSPVSTVVYSTAASDPDGDRITYSLGGADSNLLTIDASGAVRLKAPADFETRSTYTFSVIASDSGPVPAVRDVTLHVTNVNEGTPIIAETTGANDGIATAQIVARAALGISANPNLPNDDLPSATIQGTIAANPDRDFFAIALQAGERLILDVDGTGNGLDSHVRVYGPGGNEIGNNDDHEVFDTGSTATIADHNTDSLFSFRAPSAGTYFFSIEGFESRSSGFYQLHVSVGPPATLAEIISEDIDALISGLSWGTNTLSYAFPTSVSQYPDDIDETDPASDFAPFTATQQQATSQLLQLVANVSNLTFQLGNPASAHLRFAMSSEADPAYAYYPPRGGGLGGTAWFNKLDFNNPFKGDYAWMAVLHEAGHTLGLKHGHEGLAISPDRDSLEYSVMTYRSYPGASVGGPNDGYSNETWGYPQTLMMLDIGALQRLYGANFNYNATDTTYRWNTGTGEFSINGAGQGAPGVNRVFMTLWDGGGNDTYDLSNYLVGTIINLRPGEWTTSSTQLANLGDGHMARGNVANALLHDGDPRSLIENAIGGSGGDTLIANAAANRLTGGGAVDIFRWDAAADLGLGSGVDIVTDFVSGIDKIDLVRIDGQVSTPVDDGFQFIGTAAFSPPQGPYGQLRYDVEGSNARLQGDYNGDGVADFEILFQNNPIFVSSDFLG